MPEGIKEMEWNEKEYPIVMSFQMGCH